MSNHPNYEIPILFVIFKREDITMRSFEAIRRVKPKYLYIAGDAAREGVEGEFDMVVATRNAVLKAIDWECEVRTLFQENNLGCGEGVYSAINWFFNNVEEGIVLEDDCIANESFFRYVEQMLSRFRNDSRIGMIAGTNPVKLAETQSSVIFSKYKSCWGWATWRRAWQNMDIKMKWRNTSQEKDVLMNCGYAGKDIKIWRYKIRCIEKGYVSSWDWQWYFSLAAQNQLCIYPDQNLISNIGSDENATHTGLGNITLQSRELKFPLILPEKIVASVEFDKLFYLQSLTLKSRISRLLSSKVKNKIKKFLAKWLK